MSTEDTMSPTERLEAKRAEIALSEAMQDALVSRDAEMHRRQVDVVLAGLARQGYRLTPAPSPDGLRERVEALFSTYQRVYFDEVARSALREACAAVLALLDEKP